MSRVFYSRERVSHSEISSYRKCRRQHWYQYLRRIARVASSDAAARGGLFHEIAEIYFLARKDGATHTEAGEKARLVLLERMFEEQASEVAACFNWFLEADPLGDKYTVVAVEKRFAVAVYGIHLVGAVDLIVRDTSTGEYGVIDVKTTYNFYTDTQILLESQLMEYAMLLEKNNKPVHFVGYLQVRTRTMKSTDPNDYVMLTLDRLGKHTARLRNSWEDTKSTINDILVARERYDVLGENTASPPRTAIWQVCNSCPMQKLCVAELQNQDVSLLLESSFKVKDTEQGYEV